MYGFYLLRNHTFRILLCLKFVNASRLCIQSTYINKIKLNFSPEINYAKIFYQLLCEMSVFSFPAFELAVAPGSIDPKGNASKNHDDQPLEEKSHTGTGKF